MMKRFAAVFIGAYFLPLVLCQVSTPVLTSSGIIAQYAAESCYALLQMGVTNSGVYWLQQPGNLAPIQGYCDMQSFGGGWLMCYTENGTNPINMATQTQYNPNTPYPNVGYRTDCTAYGFNEIMYINNAAPTPANVNLYTPNPNINVANLNIGSKMWFQRAPSTFNCNAQLMGFNQNNTNVLWTQMTTPYNYNNQLVMCRQGLGFFMSGYTNNCWKTCDNWCQDTSSQYYRLGGTANQDQNAQGTAFKQNGFYSLPLSTLSVGIRYRPSSNHPQCLS